MNVICFGNPYVKMGNTGHLPVLPLPLPSPLVIAYLARADRHCNPKASDGPEVWRFCTNGPK